MILRSSRPRRAALITAALALTACFVPNGAMADQEVVVTTTGAPLKVVVRKDTAIYEKPDKTSPSQSANTFDYYYVLPPEKGKELKVEPEKPEAALKDGFFRISTSDKDKGQVGWIEREDVVIWPHRQALQMRPIAERKRADFFKTDKDLKSAYTGAAVPEPLSREPALGAGTSLMPLLSEFKIKNVSGDEINGYQVAYVHERPKTVAAGTGTDAVAGTATATDGPKVDLKAASLDVVFVIDTTASMQATIDATKDVVRAVAKGLAEVKSDAAPVRFGLVAYRDRISMKDPSWYVTKTFWELNRTAATSPDAAGKGTAAPKGTDLNEFLGVLDTVTAATIGSEETPEAVLDGLRDAVHMPGWNRNGYKHVILIGDASGHVEGPKNPDKLTIDGIKAMMQPSSPDSLPDKMICHAIRVVGEDATDHGLCEAQFLKLAEGGDYSGSYATFQEKDRAEFTGKLTGLIERLRKDLLSVVPGGTPPPAPAAPPTVATAGAPSAPAPAPASTPTVDPSERATLGPLLLEMVAASKPGEGDVPTFASGYVASTDIEGKTQVEPYLLVQFGQFQTFQSILNLSVSAVRSAGDPGSRDVEKIIQTLQIACTQLSLNETIKPDTPLHVIFNYLLGFPVKSDIFNMTPQKLASMTQEDFDRWTEKVQACDSIVKAYIDDPKLWKALGRETKPELRQGFLRISELP